MSAVVGRFAPTPSGPLHFGSVVTAVGSFLDARAQGGRWLLRIDDLDPPRIETGASEHILATLEALGLEWDGEVVYQSRRGAAYRHAVERLASADLIYPCSCSRREIGVGPYPGTCRDSAPPPGARLAWRVRVDDLGVMVGDCLQGDYTQWLESYCGDFVILRADGVTAYHLAVVVDDAWQGVTHITRGSDLLESTPRQVYLQRLLGVPTPRYAHLPIVLDEHGDKLSKQSHAPAVSPANAALALYQALEFLALTPPRALRGAPCTELLAWALPRWRLAAIAPQARAYRFQS